jgi:hypothetical protein
MLKMKKDLKEKYRSINCQKLMTGSQLILLGLFLPKWRGKVF